MNRLPVRSATAYDHRPVLVDFAILDTIALRTDDGWLLTVDWGEPDTDGVFSPTLTRHDDGMRMVSAATLHELERRAGGWEKF